MLNPCINIFPVCKKCPFCYAFDWNYFCWWNKNRLTSNNVSNISHFNLNMTCFKGLHHATIDIIAFQTILSNGHTTRKSAINDTFTPQRCCFGHYFVSDPSLHLFFLVWWNQFPKHKIARQMFAWRSHPLASKGAFCM